MQLPGAVGGKQAATGMATATATAQWFLGTSFEVILLQLQLVLL